VPHRRAASGVPLAMACALLAAIATIAVPRPAPAQPPLSALQVDVDAVTRGARSSVVTIVSQRSVEDRGPRAKPGTRRTHTRVGSGVAVEPDEILTTASVVLGAERITVRASNGIQSPAWIVGVDEVFNVALLRVSQMRLPPRRFSDQRPPQMGDWVIALGTSYGGGFTQSVGYVSYRYNEPRTALLQTTNTVTPGNSGGAALNPLGDLIGIIQGELGPPDPTVAPGAEEHSGQGASFVLPLDVVRPVYESLRREGRVRHGYLGVSASAAVVPSSSEPAQIIPIGARVESVVPGSPAARAGLRPGDLIVGYDWDRVEYPTQLARWVAASRPGSGALIKWVRDEVPVSAKVVIAESPHATPHWLAGGAGLGDSARPRTRAAEALNRRPPALDSTRGEAAQGPR
jgi:S1-C subfamily serine protease